MRQFIFFFFFISILMANSNIKKPETGWRFGDLDVNKSDNLNKKSEKELLAELVRIEREQLKTQKKILKILENQFNPKPQKVVINGKECIANTSADCFVMPLTTTAKRIPVLKQWLLKRDIKSAAAYIKWQSKYLQEMAKAAYAYDFAVTEFGNKIAPLDYSRGEFEETFGYTRNLMNDKYNKLILSKYRDKFNVYIFLGKNPDLDIYSFGSLGKMYAKYPFLHYTIIFKSDNEKQTFLDASKIFIKLGRMVKDKNVGLFVNEEIFKKLNIYTTPTIAIKINNQKQINKILVGRITESYFSQKTINLLKYKGVIKEGDNSVYKVWKKVGDFAPEFYEHWYGLDKKTIEKLKNEYKEER